MKSAANAENFEEAARIKKELEDFERNLATCGDHVREAKLNNRQIYNEMCEFRFRERPASLGVKLTRVVIGYFDDPDHKHDIEIFYFHSHDNVSFYFDGLSFDSDACYLDEWAFENNLAIHSETFDFSGKDVSLWPPTS